MFHFTKLSSRQVTLAFLLFIPCVLTGTIVHSTGNSFASQANVPGRVWSKSGKFEKSSDLNKALSIFDFDNNKYGPFVGVNATAPGDLDSTFGNGGIVTTSFPTTNS